MPTELHAGYSVVWMALWWEKRCGEVITGANEMKNMISQQKNCACNCAAQSTMRTTHFFQESALYAVQI